MGVFWCEWAWLPEGPAKGVLVETDGGRITEVRRTEGPGEAEVLAGMVLPGLANAHSHAFHRALRGDTTRGTFWTWRERMYQVAAALDPDTYYRLARGVYAEMVQAGITGVGEFHYLHHAPGGVGYRDPNAMNHALAQAARDAGIRLTLLDTCYLAGGFGRELDSVQRRFSDVDAAGWMRRVERFDAEDVLIGAALHSVRAVPAEAIREIASYASRGPLHVHLSEQRAENDACLAAHGCTPTELLAERGALGNNVTAVHATHLTSRDVALLGDSATDVCLCPGTEADLADGIGPAGELRSAGSAISLGSDGHSSIDILGESQAVEAHQRLATETRGHHTPAEMLEMATAHSSIGYPDAGRLEVGARADFVAIDMGSARLAGVDPHAVPVVARADDVRDVIVEGRHIVRQGSHVVVDTARELRESISALRT